MPTGYADDSLHDRLVVYDARRIAQNTFALMAIGQMHILFLVLFLYFGIQFDCFISFFMNLLVVAARRYTRFISFAFELWILLRFSCG